MAASDESTATGGETPEPAPASGPRPLARRSVRVSVATLVTAGAGALLVAATATFGVLWGITSGHLADRDAAAADERQAERVATDYALGASTIDYRDLNAWVGKLKGNTSGELAAKFDTTAPKLREVLTPLRWTSSATPVAAKVMSDENGVYSVNVFLNVTSTSAQAPDGGLTTVVYKVTVNKGAGWKITEVGSDASPAAQNTARGGTPK
ncbi:hypothetical protein [Nocardia sp. NPDC005825]|uniref:hypothetical protein n=1 Tax=unclassified Nocardia TaxID=2637762 RepID=UPI0033D7261C